MDINNVNNEEKDAQRKNILDLPAELLITIFSFIRVKSLFKSISLTCKYFNEILTAPGIWEILFAAKFSRHNIHADLDYISELRNVCLSYEDIWKYWKKSKHLDDTIELNVVSLKGLSNPVDAVHILPKYPNICVAGSRDRNILLWNLKDFIHNNKRENVKPVGDLLGHKGWVWAIKSEEYSPNKVVSASWDKKLKVWDIDANGALIDTLAYHPTPILDLCCLNNIYTTGCFGGYLRLYDPRSKCIVASSRHHKGSVTCLKTTDTQVITGGEDCTVKIYDKRANKTLSSLKFDSPVFCMDVGFDQGFNYLRVGGKNGAYYIYHFEGDRLTLLESLQLWENYKVTALSKFQGSLVACSQSGCVRMYTPDRQCMMLKSFSNHQADVPAADSNHNLLVTGSSDASVKAWTFLEK